MRTLTERWKAVFSRRLIVPIVAMGMVFSVATYQFAKPAKAAAPAPAPAAAPLDDSSVDALLALDRAMETVAARVTPAMVNVTVTQKSSAVRGDAAEGGDGDNSDSDGIQQFFFSPFGRRF